MKKHNNFCKNGICDLNMFDFCRCDDAWKNLKPERIRKVKVRLPKK